MEIFQGGTYNLPKGIVQQKLTGRQKYTVDPNDRYSHNVGGREVLFSI